MTQVAHRIDGALRDLGDGWVEGEIRSIKQHSSGHVYLTLADEDSNLDACIWRGRLKRCLPLPKQGDLVQAHYERVDFYAPRGATKLLIDELRPTGEGELLRRRAEVLMRLRADGLCEEHRRKPLPAFPRRVGVIAAQASDAKVDVIRHLRERMPSQDIVFAAAAVQGVEAVGSVIDALGRLQAIDDIDVIILARGGGSVADLIAFDDERLCRAVFACAVPVITSIGHTKDRPNCDYVAAAFAPVPAKAAEYAIAHSAESLLGEFDRHRNGLHSAATAIRRRSEEVAGCAERLRPSQRIASLATDIAGAGQLLGSRALTRHGAQALALNGTREQLQRAAEAFFLAHRDTLDERASQLDGINRRLPRSASLDVCAARLENAAVRMRERKRDYGRALDRLDVEAQRELRRRLLGELANLDGNVGLLRGGGERVLARAHERVAQLGALVRAKDFRSRGWVLACDERQRPIRGTSELERGMSIQLRFSDGEATATVEDIQSSQQGEGL